MRRGRAIRARRRGAVASCVAVVAVAVAVTASVQALSPAGKLAPTRPAGHPSRHEVTLNVPDPRAPGGVFASGITDGRPWRLAVQNIAGPTPRCLPTVMLNGRDGDLLFYRPGRTPLISNTAFLTDPGSQPGTGYAFVEVGSGVTRLAVTLRDGARLIVRPVAVRLCGQQFHLAGFGYPSSGVAAVAAFVGDRATFTYRPVPGTFSPDSPFPAGTWNSTAGGSDAASGYVGSGMVNGRSWRMQVTLGSDGECFGAMLGRSGAAGGANVCRSIGLPPAGASVTYLPFASPGGLVIWYEGTVSARTAYLRGPPVRWRHDPGGTRGGSGAKILRPGDDGEHHAPAADPV